VADAHFNWARNLRYTTDRLHEPASVEQLCDTVARLDRLRALGSRHCFNAIADSDANLVSTAKLDRIIAIDAAARCVTIEAGVTYGQLGPALHAAGFALPNLASLPHINVAGATATATHGSGDALGSLSASVTALAFVNASGGLVTLSRDADPGVFPGAVVHLGALGVVARLTLAIQPTYDVVQHVYEGLPLDTLVREFDAVSGAGTSVSWFTAWGDRPTGNLWVKRRVEPGDAAPSPRELFGATLAPAPRHPLRDIDPVHCTTQGRPGAWHERLPHFRVAYTPSAGDELQAEYLVARRHAAGALGAVAGLGERIAPLLLTSEVRTVAGDDLWLSMAYERDSVCIHFTLRPDAAGVAGLLPDIEAALSPFDARPHWGKLFAMPGDRLAALYPRLADFRALARRMDGGGKFRNAFVDALVFGMPD